MKLPCKLEFRETGGYDCMFGAWKIIDADERTIATIDLGEYGQTPCDYEYRSQEAEEDAKKLFEGLKCIGH